MQLIKEENKHIGFPLLHTSAHTRGEMIYIDCIHVSFNRYLLLTVGLWPYQQTKLAQFQLALLFSVLATFILVQVR